MKNNKQKRPGTTTIYCYCATCNIILLDRDIQETEYNHHFADASEENLQIQKDEHTKATGHQSYTQTNTLNTHCERPGYLDHIKYGSTL